MKKSILETMQQSDQVVHTVKSADADELVKDGLARTVNVQPAPAKGHTAIALTTKGRTAGIPASADAQGQENS